MILSDALLAVLVAAFPRSCHKKFLTDPRCVRLFTRTPHRSCTSTAGEPYKSYSTSNASQLSAQGTPMLPYPPPQQQIPHTPITRAWGRIPLRARDLLFYVPRPTTIRFKAQHSPLRQRREKQRSRTYPFYRAILNRHEQLYISTREQRLMGLPTATHISLRPVSHQQRKATIRLAASRRRRRHGHRHCPTVEATAENEMTRREARREMAKQVRTESGWWMKPGSADYPWARCWSDPTQAALDFIGANRLWANLTLLWYASLTGGWGIEGSKC